MGEGGSKEYRPHKIDTGGKPIFGMPLKEAAGKTDVNGQIPHIVRSAIDFLNAYGLEEEGIYRINGSTRVVNEYMEKINSGELIEFLLLTKWEKVSPSNVAKLCISNSYIILYSFVFL